MSGRRRQVIFVHRSAHNRNGSKLMRCDQLCRIAGAHLSDRYEFEVRALPRLGEARRIARTLEAMDDAIVILLKRADVSFDDRHIEILRNRPRAVLIDYVDAGIDARALDIADGHIAASVAGLRGMTELIAQLGRGGSAAPVLLHHHADPRIGWRDRRHESVATLGYFGLPAHAAVPAPLSKRIAMPDYGVQGGFEGMLAAMADCNTHYCIRPRRRVKNSWKPFTKGINAAAAGAAVLVAADVEDAVELLGADYPFLIPDGSPEAVQAGVDRLDATVGSAEWHRALDAMEALRARTSQARLMADFRAILDRFA